MKGIARFVISRVNYKQNTIGTLGGSPRGCGGMAIILGIIVLLFLGMVFFG